MIRPSEIAAPNDLALETFWRVQQSRLVRNLLTTAGFFALSDLGIRIVGEEGSGKLHLAKLIHRYSSRGAFSFTHIDCSGLGSDDPDEALFGSEDHDGTASGSASGLLETADQGTIYLDMISALPVETQARLIRALELRRFRRNGGHQDIHMNVRIITGRTQSGGVHFPKTGPEPDLAARVSPVCINIPPLRERREDIEPLIYLFLGEYSKEKSGNVSQITAEALRTCLYYDWPGNIYELRNVIRHSAHRCDGPTLEVPHLPEYIFNDDDLHKVRLSAVNAGIQQ